MDPDVVIQVRDLGKRFALQAAAHRTLKAMALDWIRRERRPDHDFWALRHIDFSVRRGETLGIVGANGAGKSTLLSLLAGTKTPTEGHLEIRGKTSSLLELGAGFHPELTGRENVFLAGAMMGLSRARMAERFDAIVEFAELPSFIDQPVKHYSSGMYVRLGFAVAVEVDPDILLLDEVLAVGDSSFQQKCLDRMEAFRRAGKTMLIISHDLETIKRISHRILFLDRGRILGLGDPYDMIDQYDAHSLARGAEGLRREWGTGEVMIRDVELRNAEGHTASAFRWGEPLVVRFGYQTQKRVQEPVFGFSFSDGLGRPVYGNNTQIEDVAIPSIEGAGQVELRIDELRMGRGDYLLSLSVHSSDHKTNYHRLDHCCAFTVEAEKPFEGCYMPVRWST